MHANRFTDYMYSLVKKVTDEIGPRPPCSPQEKELGRLLVKEWKSICNKVDVETFTCSPSAFLGFIRFSALLYFGVVISYWFVPPLSFALAVIAFSMLFFELLRYREFVDFLFPRQQGENVIGFIRPVNEPVRRVIVGAHMDSAYEFNLIHYVRRAAIFILVVAVLAIFIALWVSLAKTVAYSIGYGNSTVFTALGFTMVALTPFVGFCLFFHSGRSVPGAMDNMSGIAVITGVGRYLSEAKTNGDWFPARTEVVLLATSSEEAGLRGAKRYVSKHIQEMKAVPTYGLILDCIYDERFLTVSEREPCTGARHDPHLIKMAQNVAAEHNWPMAVSWIPIGGTDAAAFTVKGIPSICLLCMDTSKAVPNYHTRHDTHEYIRPESLSVSLQLIIDMIERIDGMQSDLPTVIKR